MDEYARAAARVHAGLRALQAVPDVLRESYSDEFTRELVCAVEFAQGGSLTFASLFIVLCTNYSQETWASTNAVYCGTDEDDCGAM